MANATFRIWRTQPGGGGAPVDSQAVTPGTTVDLLAAWRIRDVEIPSRLVLAPMAGVSVQAFRRQGRRFGAGLVCSEMVSCAGLHHRNDRTLDYLRIARDERLPAPIVGESARRSAELFRHGSMHLRWYAPSASGLTHDPQTPHDRDELYIVISGRGYFERRGRTTPTA
mgnify:CR=1 FL=1